MSCRPTFELALPDRTIELGPRTLIMGVLNVTPDSFSDGGRFLDPVSAIAHARRLAAEGADILDLGGESTRPGAPAVSVDEELSRVLPVLEGLGGDFPIPVSIDTSKAAVARAALKAGASIVNDVTALAGDPGMARAAADSGAAVVLMHMRGTPRDMQTRTPSPDILAEIEAWAPVAVERATTVGISCDRIVLDPGIGFGKTVSQNLAVLRNLGRLASTGFPLLVGTSRKSFIGAVLKDRVADRSWGTAASVAASILLGAHIVRVHDVASMRQVAMVADAILAERVQE